MTIQQQSRGNYSKPWYFLTSKVWIIRHFPHCLYCVLTSNNPKSHHSLLEFKFLDKGLYSMVSLSNSVGIAKVGTLARDPCSTITSSFNCCRQPFIICLCIHMLVCDVDVPMATFTLRPSTSSRGSHPWMYSGFRWLWMAWLIVSKALGCVFEFFYIHNKPSKVASFGFLGALYPWLIPSFVSQVSLRVFP